MFTCNGRGKRLFGTPHHDAALVAEVLGAGLSPGGVPSLSPALAGLFAAGEIGPIGRRNFVHGFTASIALFSDRNPDGQQVVARAAPPPTP